MTTSSSHTDSQQHKPATHQGGASAQPSRAAVALFCVVAVVWVIFDQLTKVYFEGTYELGQTSPGDFGLFRFRLVHNTGMAWGMFGDSTFALGILSCVVCAAILVTFLLWPRFTGHRLNWLETLGLALVFSGGLGNALDRFLQGFVVDFIDLTFMDFPVFNIADIGVTCGFVIIVLGFLIAERKAARAEDTEAPEASESLDGHEAPTSPVTFERIVSHAESDVNANSDGEEEDRRG